MLSTLSLEEKYIYLAAIIDSRGSFYIKMHRTTARNYNKWSYGIIITHHHHDYLIKLIEIFNNGNKELLKQVYETVNKKKITFRWRITGNVLKTLLSGVFSHLFIKKEHATIMLEYLQTTLHAESKNISKGISKTRSECASRLHALKTL